MLSITPTINVFLAIDPVDMRNYAELVIMLSFGFEIRNSAGIRDVRSAR